LNVILNNYSLSYCVVSQVLNVQVQVQKAQMSDRQKQESQSVFEDLSLIRFTVYSDSWQFANSVRQPIILRHMWYPVPERK